VNLASKSKTKNWQKQTDKLIGINNIKKACSGRKKAANLNFKNIRKSALDYRENWSK
jgi:hypothetical protein